ncbi:hypothetical protein STEG23_027846 [Scotinomys teguina]
MSTVMLLPGTNGSLLLVQRTVTRTIVLHEAIGKEPCALAKVSLLFLHVYTNGISEITNRAKKTACHPEAILLTQVTVFMQRIPVLSVTDGIQGTGYMCVGRAGEATSFSSSTKQRMIVPEGGEENKTAGEDRAF